MSRESFYKLTWDRGCVAMLVSSKGEYACRSLTARCRADK